MKPDGKKVLIVGLVCVDFIAECNEYPKEDTDQRCTEIRKQKGGNGSNSSFVLAELGQEVDLLANIGSGQETDFVLGQMSNVNLENCPRLDAPLPSSMVIINEKNGSRTILHSGQSLPELELEDFKKLDLIQYSWIHFEGRSRNVDNIILMIESIRNHNSVSTDPITISIEVEKARSEIIKLLGYGDVLFISKDHVKFHNFTSAEEGLHHLSERCRPNATCICAWGEKGAWARLPNGDIYKSPACPPPKVVDTLGAGDTFNAVMIYCKMRQWQIQKSLEKACQISGAKVGQKGYNGLRRLL